MRIDEEESLFGIMVARVNGRAAVDERLAHGHGIHARNIGSTTILVRVCGLPVTSRSAKTLTPGMPCSAATITSTLAFCPGFPRGVVKVREPLHALDDAHQPSLEGFIARLMPVPCKAAAATRSPLTGDHA